MWADKMQERVRDVEADAARYQYIRSHRYWLRHKDNLLAPLIGVEPESYALVGCKFPYEYDFQSKIMFDINIDKMIEKE